MANKICFPKDVIEKVKALDLENMSTNQRIKAFDEVLGGSNGKEMNVLYEKSKLLKNQKTSLDKFFTKVTELSPEDKIKLQQKIDERLARIDNTIDDEELAGIVQDAVERKYKIDLPETIKIKGKDVNTEEYIFNINKEIKQLEDLAEGTVDGSPEKLAWGNKIVELSDTVNKLKEVETSIKGKLKLSGERIKNTFKEDTLGGIGQTVSEGLDTVFSPVLKSVKASLDASYAFRQGLKVLSANKGIYGKNLGQSLGVWKKVLNNQSMDDLVKAFKADMVTRDLYQDMVRSKLAVGVVEDFFPSSLVQNIKGFGNLFKASDDSFTMFSQGSRMDLFENYVNAYKASNNGAKPPADVMKGFARVINSVTGRGGLGSLEASSNFLNKILFSARYQTANINTVRHAFDTTLPLEVRRIAQKNLINHIKLISGIGLTLSAFGDFGWDPRESTFGKFRMPGTKKWIDVTGGLGSYIAVIGKTGKATLGKQQYGKDTGMDILVDFMKGKLAPAPGVLRDILEQRDYSGKTPTVGSTLESLFIPITAENALDSIRAREDAYEALIPFLLETGGFSVTQPKSKREGSYWSPRDLFQ